VLGHDHVVFAVDMEERGGVANSVSQIGSKGMNAPSTQTPNSLVAIQTLDQPPSHGGDMEETYNRG